MIKLVDFLLSIFPENPSLAPAVRQQGFAEFYVYGRFVKFIDLR